MTAPLVPAICILASLTLMACSSGGGGRAPESYSGALPLVQPEALPPPPDLKNTEALLNFVLADGQAHLVEDMDIDAEVDYYGDDPSHPIYARAFEKNGKAGAVTLHEHKAGVPTLIAVSAEGEKTQFKIMDDLPVFTGRAYAYYGGMYTASYSLDGGKTWRLGEGYGAHVYVDSENGQVGSTGGVTNLADDNEYLRIGIAAKIENGKISTGEFGYFHHMRDGELIQEYKDPKVQGVLIGEEGGPSEGLAATLELEEGDFIVNAGLIAQYESEIGYSHPN